MSGPESVPEPRAAMPVTRGFLFADLRGYTHFVQGHGDTAARDLLQSYRELVRGIIGRFEGAEIRTEGDSFYVVFPSASGAVRCALEIIAEAAHRRDRPIDIGIGIHAGEAAEDAEGYVGLAVNIAARICAQARPGEVLVSDTVRSLTRSSGALTFTPRGRPHLKGVSEPVPVFAVTDGRASMATRAPRGRIDDRRSAAVAGAAVALAVTIAAIGGFLALGMFRGGGGATGSPDHAPIASPSSLAEPSIAVVASDGPAGSPVPLALPMSDGLAPHVTAVPGFYATSNFEPSMEFHLPIGWEATSDDPDFVSLIRQTSPRGLSDGALSFSRVHVAFTAPCAASKTSLIGQGPDAMLDWIQGLDYLSLSQPTTVYVGGASGVRLDATVAPKGPGCPNVPRTDSDWYALFPEGRGEFYLQPGSKVSFTVLDVGDKTVLMTTEQTPDRVTDFLKEVDSLLVTLDFR